MNQKNSNENILDSDPTDIVGNLRDMAYIIDESQGKAVVTMLSGSMLNEAADEIEKLREETNDLRFQIVNLSIPKDSDRD